MVTGKKLFALINYEVCNLSKCDPDKGICKAVKACPHNIIKQIDGDFKVPMMLYQDLCQGCGDCVEACPLDAIKMKYVP